jgi:hypothetical protein
MKNFTGFEWLLVDVANQYGLDKLLFEERIQWCRDNLSDLELRGQEQQADHDAKGKVWKEAPLFHKAVMAVRKAQQGIPTGHMVGVDATCSGIQMMSALTGCVAGADATGLVDPNRRADAYTGCTDLMNEILEEDGLSVDVPRSDAKDALMTSFYGSKAKPKEIFGEGTAELEAFYRAAQELAPGAWELLQILLASWNPNALQHDWKLPDGFDAVVRVMVEREVRIEVDELDHASFTHQFKENGCEERGRANAANVVHSVDGYVLREMHRRCNHDRAHMLQVHGIVLEELSLRAHNPAAVPDGVPQKVAYYMKQFNRSTLASAVILPLLDTTSVRALSLEHLEAVNHILNGMLTHRPFPLVTVHDEFKAHPNNINQVRWHYKEILAEIADSDLLSDLLTQVHKRSYGFDKLSFNLSDLIRDSNYALC